MTTTPQPRLVGHEQRIFATMCEVKRQRRGMTGPAQAVNSPEQQARRSDLLLALQAYAEAVSSAGAPLPYRVRDEMRLLRAMGHTKPTL